MLIGIILVAVAIIGIITLFLNRKKLFSSKEDEASTTISLAPGDIIMVDSEGIDIIRGRPPSIKRLVNRPDKFTVRLIEGREIKPKVYP
jgi:hypothetical protein